LIFSSYRRTRKTDNIFPTNIHRVYAGNDVEPSFDDDDLMDYFLGKRPTGATTDSKVNLSDIDELKFPKNSSSHHA
jgi:type III restriction enzyme